MGIRGERLKRFIQDIFERVRALIQSPDGNRRIAGILAADELGETKVFGDSMNRLSDLIRILMEAFVFPGVDQTAAGGCQARQLRRSRCRREGSRWQRRRWRT